MSLSDYKVPRKAPKLSLPILYHTPLHPITLPNTPSLLLLNDHYILPLDSGPKDIFLADPPLLSQLRRFRFNLYFLLLLLVFRR